MEEWVENKDSIEKLSAKEDITKYESEKEFEIKRQLDSLNILTKSEYNKQKLKQKRKRLEHKK